MMSVILPQPSRENNLVADGKGHWKRKGGSYLYIHLYYRTVVGTFLKVKGMGVASFPWEIKFIYEQIIIFSFNLPLSSVEAIKMKYNFLLSK